MNDELQLVLIILGLMAIAGVLVHGYWTNKKNKAQSIEEKPFTPLYQDPENPPRDADGFDPDGVGQVRIVKNSETKPAEPSEPLEPVIKLDAEEDDIRTEPVISTPAAETKSEGPMQLGLGGFDIEGDSLPSASAELKPKTQRRRTEPKMDAPEPQLNLDDNFELSPSPAQAEPVIESSSVAETPAFDEPLIAEPKIEDLVTEDLGTEEPVIAAPAEAVVNESAVAQAQPATSGAASPEPQAASAEPQDVLVLHVQAQPGEQLAGAELLPCMLTLGLKFGEMNIFHRHQDPAGTGKVIYSLANMMKPGTFDPDNMEQFKTEGVVLFLQLPCPGEAKLSFSTMLNAAHQLADDLNGVVTDDARNPWSDASRSAYLERIKTVYRSVPA
ncbi:cell division protein ZipA [Paraferrimonas sedimenticola]|uniref:Cell division protein ZipA n=1 Tax=Paraferrimonas sedimenticola TaxID=375674 RepID=A0AA37RR09_9GAMM|nr:cell division protein ZipA [Paraferrimonas sedimenticola]GLP94743.1 cell division protein ZipA [Paraferrimonas sedimenticola]